MRDVGREAGGGEQGDTRRRADTQAGHVGHAGITIDAPASTIWPWLVQLGSARGGAYTYDWIKNIFGLDVHSAEGILPEFQHLEVGDVLPMGRSGCVLLPEQSFPFAAGSQPPPRVEPTRLHLARATRRVRSRMPLASSHALNRRGRCEASTTMPAWRRRDAGSYCIGIRGIPARGSAQSPDGHYM